MPCTTILIGKEASFDGSTIMARNEDSPAGGYCPKKFIVVKPEEQPRLYKSVISGVEIELPDNPMRYTAMPNAIPTEGIWGEAGFNELNIAMSETETITANPRVLGADPLVKEGIGEEDMLTLVLPYIKSAREGVLRLGSLLETYGTYEMNGIGFQDADEVWWLESLGGHHWLAVRCPDNEYAVGPNQRGIDVFDFMDAFSEGKDYLCSLDLIEFIEENHLDVTFHEVPLRERIDFDARAAFGTHTETDHMYNTPRAWFMHRYLNPTRIKWDGEDTDFSPESDDLPWSLCPEKKVTIEDVKYVLSSYYQGTKYDPYDKDHVGGNGIQGKYRPIGINRNNFLAITQIRPYVPNEIAAVEWISVGSNAFNASVPFYSNVNDTPDYLKSTSDLNTTENFYWANRIIAALADASYGKSIVFIERYQAMMQAEGNRFLRETDKLYKEKAGSLTPEEVSAFLEEQNQKMADFAREKTYELLDQVLTAASNGMKNSFSRSDN